MSSLVLTAVIFVLAYILIISEKVSRVVVALLGGTSMIVFHILSQDEALEHIDFNTLGLLIGMMIVVNIIKRTGLFQYLAIKMAQVSKGEPTKIIIYFSLITAIASGLLDNVTTILLIVPVTLVIADSLKINPIPFIIAEVLSANIGGAATLIGDPPNIMIGSYTGYGFLTFLINLGPLMLINLVVVLLLIKFLYRKSLIVGEEDKKKVLKMNPKLAITDKKLLIKSLIVLGLIITGFTIAEFVNLESASIALLGAAVLLLISRFDPEEILLDVEWGTIFFFGGLFVLVGALQSVGIIKILADQLLTITKGNLQVTTTLVLWMSAVLSSFLDNIPYVATMLPLVNELKGFTDGNFEVVWWALSIGACLGGNGTIIGASANVVARGILEKQKHELSFLKFMKVAFPLMLVTITISTIYLFVFYL